MPADTAESRPPESESSSASPSPEPRADPDLSEVPPTDALRSAWSRIAEIGEFALQYLTAQRDLLKVRLRNVAILAVLALVGLVALAALVVTLIVMLCSGLAQVIAAGLGGRIWAGNLIVSFGLLAIMAGGASLALRSVRRKWFNETRAKYERLHQQQRGKFGKSAFERAHSKASGEQRD